MTPASARSLRRADVAELRRAEPDLSLRQMAQRLGMSRDTVRRDLADLDAAAAQSATAAADPATPVADSASGDADGTDQVAQSAPQVSGGGALGVAQDAPRTGLPRRVAQPLDGIDVRRSAALRRDLAVLAQTGFSPEAIVHQAVLELAHHYRKALNSGALPPNRPFNVRAMTFVALPAPAARSAPAAPPPGEGA